MANILLQSPSQINIVRTAISCPDSPREVGDGMEMEKEEKREKDAVKLPLVHLNSRRSSGYSTPVQSLSPRLSERTSLVQRSQSQRSIADQDDTFSHRESLPSPSPSDAITMKNEKFLIEEKMALKDHLQIQVQVNQELRRLVVASIGEDLGFHYERIATEKAQIELENEELKRQLNIQVEEIERLDISCDVWRSKFLASRVQCDETQDKFLNLQRRQREMDTAIRGLIREHRTRSEHLEEIHDTLKHLNDALQWGKKETSKKPKKDSFEKPIDEECLKLSNMVSSRLLGTSKFPHPKSAGYKKYLSSWKRMTPEKTMQTETEYEVKATLAEKYVTQLLREANNTSVTPGGMSGLNFYARPSVIERKNSGSVMGRFHPHAKYDNITLACCSKCKGDIHVI